MLCLNCLYCTSTLSRLSSVLLQTIAISSALYLCSIHGILHVVIYHYLFFKRKNHIFVFVTIHLSATVCIFGENFL